MDFLSMGARTAWYDIGGKIFLTVEIDSNRFDACVSRGEYPQCWKSTRLVLLRVDNASVTKGEVDDLQS